MTTTDHSTTAHHWDVLALPLLRRRSELALAASEHTGHELPGAEMLWREVAAVEDQIKVQFPKVWKRHLEEWLALDVARMHTEDEPRPAYCRLCWEHLEEPGVRRQVF